jgi:hypothetical protein
MKLCTANLQSLEKVYASRNTFVWSKFDVNLSMSGFLPMFTGTVALVQLQSLAFVRTSYFSFAIILHSSIHSPLLANFWEFKLLTIS